VIFEYREEQDRVDVEMSADTFRMYLERAGCDVTEEDLDLLWTVLVKESSPAEQEVPLERLVARVKRHSSLRQMSIEGAGDGAQRREEYPDVKSFLGSLTRQSSQSIASVRV